MQTKLKYVFTILSLTLSDQIVKYLIQQRILNIAFLCNPGIAFGFKLGPFFILSLNLIIFVYLLYYLFSKAFLNLSFPLKIGLILIIAGASSNLFDRLLLKCVIDYIDLKIWPVFNLADTYICLGISIFLIKTIKKKKSA